VVAPGARLRFWLSLPERTLRTSAGVLAGAARESAAVLVPQSFQSSKTYTVMVRQMLDFLAEDVGGVARDLQAASPKNVENFVARKTVGNFVEMAALATLHISPLTILAVLSDVAYGSQAYLHELAAELKKQGVIDQNSTIDHVNDLLTAVSSASSLTAKAFDTPPLSIAGLKATIDETRAAVASIDPAKIIPEAEMRRLWDEMHAVAAREGVDLLTVSGAMTMQSMGKFAVMGKGALSSVKVAGTLFDRHVLDHYSTALSRISERGLYRSLAETSEPYVAAVWQNFSSRKGTMTEDVLSGRLLGAAWIGVRKWLGGTPEPESPAIEPSSGPRV